MGSKTKKNVLAAVLLGFIFPGLGLLYVAPLSVVAVVTLFSIVALKLFGGFWLLGSLVAGVLALGSAGLGYVYATAYNRLGHRHTLLLPR